MDNYKIHRPQFGFNVGSDENAHRINETTQNQKLGDSIIEKFIEQEDAEQKWPTQVIKTLESQSSISIDQQMAELGLDFLKKPKAEQEKQRKKQEWRQLKTSDILEKIKQDMRQEEDAQAGASGEPSAQHDPVLSIQSEEEFELNR